MWLSQLALPMTLIQRKEPLINGLVLMATEFGVLLWILDFDKLDNTRYYYLRSWVFKSSWSLGFRAPLGLKV
jgi:hypothetical protein